jgi:hypothetical protein
MYINHFTHPFLIRNKIKEWANECRHASELLIEMRKVMCEDTHHGVLLTDAANSSPVFLPL